MSPSSLLLLAATAALLTGCRSRPVPIVLRPGMTVEEARLACEAAGVRAESGNSMGSRSHYHENYRLSDGREMNLVTDHTKSPPIIVSGEIASRREESPKVGPTP